MVALRTFSVLSCFFSRQNFFLFSRQIILNKTKHEYKLQTNWNYLESNISSCIWCYDEIFVFNGMEWNRCETVSLLLSWMCIWNRTRWTKVKTEPILTNKLRGSFPTGPNTKSDLHRYSRILAYFKCKCAYAQIFPFQTFKWIYS